MKWRWIVLFVLLLIFLGIYFFLEENDSVALSSESSFPVLGYPYDLHFGESVFIEDTEDSSGRVFHIIFSDVLEDSRCIKKSCSEKGKAVLLISTETLGVKNEIQLLQEGSNQQNNPVLFDFHGVIRLINLEPSPSSKLNKEDYVARIVVTHA